MDNHSVKTGFYDFPSFVGGKPDSVGIDTSLAKGAPAGSTSESMKVRTDDHKEPWGILSDSRGSIPRMNVAGEFHGKDSTAGWGSDWPTPWVFEVRLHRNRAKGRALFGFYYAIERVKDYAEVPRLNDWKGFYARR